MPWYDNWGWASQTEIPGRFTAAPVPENIPVGYAANWTGYEWRVMPYFTPATQPVGRRITKLAFRTRFTAEERTAITFAARQATAQGAAVQAYLDDVQAATFIDLDRVDTRAGVEALESAGLLTAGRAAAILDGEIAESDRYTGGG